MRKRRGSLILSLVFAAMAATLVFAAGAAAETKIGEGTSPEQPALPGEADLLKASAEYDLATGSATVAITTRQALESTPEEKRPFVQYIAAFVTVNFPCTKTAFEEESKKETEGEGAPFDFPLFEMLSFNRSVEAPPGVAEAPAYGLLVSSLKEEEKGPNPADFVPGTRMIDGTTATINVTTPKAANQSFNCVEVGAENFEGGEEPDFLVFGLTTKPEPPPEQPATPAQPAQNTPPPAKPAPAPGALSFGKAAKPLRLKVGAWKSVKVKVTNTGGSPVGQGALQVRAPKGVLVKPGRQKLPALQPGDSWTVTYRVKLTAKAKAKSKLSLTATSGALSTKGAQVLKRAG
jgi:hypothetical protein